MLAGLIFATADANDRPDQLAATLPFGGATLLEFQARLLIAAGAAQLLVVVARLTPELIGAVNRITRRGLSVDIVRTAAEAEDKLHPLARVLVVADGLVTAEPVIELLSGEGGDTLLVTTDEHALPGLERVGVNAIWAGLARVEVQRIADVAAMPRDYDFQSALLRVAAQSGAAQLALPLGAVRAGHGVEHDAARLRDRNDAVLAGHVSNRISWVERRIVAPVVRRLLPIIMARRISSALIGGGAAAVLAAGLGLIGWGWPVAGWPLLLVALLGLSCGAVLSWMRDDQRFAQVQRAAVGAGAAAAVLLLGLSISRAEGTATAIVVALMLVIAAALVERGASDAIRQGWWSKPVAFPVVLLPFVLLAMPLTGLSLAAGYAALSLAAVIEALREKP